MGCSHFHLDRENPKRAEEYRSLKISPVTESAWRLEEFDRQLSTFASNDNDKLGYKYSYLADLIETTDYYLQYLCDLIISVVDRIPLEQINITLATIIGNNSTKSHGGLIEKSHSRKRYDLVDRFITTSFTLIEKAEKESIEINYLGNLADVIEYFKILNRIDVVSELRSKDDRLCFKYSEIGANEGNKYSMNMLSMYYREGKGCEKDNDKALYWEQKSKE